jgi:hypothetical protein
LASIQPSWHVAITARARVEPRLPMLLPGIKLNTSPTDHVPVDQMQFMCFNSKSWERFGELQTGN